LVVLYVAGCGPEPASGPATGSPEPALASSAIATASQPPPTRTELPQDQPTPTLTAAPTAPPMPSPTTQPTAAPVVVVGKVLDRPGVYYDRLILRNYPRWFKVHVPSGYQPGQPMPMVLNLHGLGGNLDQQEALSGLSATADAAGFVVVYPQAGASVWNIQAGDIGAIDVDFVREIILYLEERLSIDPARVYATGFSNGGGMAHRLACDLADRIAAIAPVSGAYMQDEPCEPGRPVPVLAFHGTADRYAPFVNEKVGQDIPQWAADWAARNGCDLKPASTQVADGVHVQSWQN
jgi:polyhydroxybutyrate depolymerase